MIQLVPLEWVTMWAAANKIIISDVALGCSAAYAGQGPGRRERSDRGAGSWGGGLGHRGTAQGLQSEQPAPKPRCTRAGPPPSLPQTTQLNVFRNPRSFVNGVRGFAVDVGRTRGWCLVCGEEVEARTAAKCGHPLHPACQKYGADGSCRICRLGVAWLGPQRVEELRVATANIPNVDGSLSFPTKQLGDVMRSLGEDPSEAQVQDMINEVDGDGIGFIDFRDFLKLVGRREMDEASEEEIRNACCAFDKDGSGFISAAELREALLSLPLWFRQDEVDELLRKARFNGRGQVAYEDVVTERALILKRVSQ